MSYSPVSGPKNTGLLSPNAGGIALDQVFLILDILTYSRDTHDQSLMLCKTDPNFARF